MTSAPPRSHPHRVRFAPVLAACALALLPGWASAQSLRELYDAARAYDATYLAARSLADSAQYRAAQADALNRPNVGLVANASRTDVEVPSTVTGPGRTPIPLTAGHFFNNRVDATVSAIQPLYNRGNDATISQAQRGLEVAMSDLESAEQDLIIRVAQAYFGVQSLQAQVKALEAAESSSQLALEATQLGYKVGVRVNLDVLNAQTQLYTTRRDLAKARYDVLVNSLKLRQAAGTLAAEDVLKINQLIAK